MFLLLHPSESAVWHTFCNQSKDKDFCFSARTFTRAPGTPSMRILIMIASENKTQQASWTRAARYFEYRKVGNPVGRQTGKLNA